MSKLVCKDLIVQYFGYDAAINHVTTNFSDGINVVFAAEKGGKTTFLKALAGIIPHQGELYLDDVNVDDIPLKDRDFQMLFDDYALFPRRSVRYNLEYPLKIRKVPKAERRRMVEEIASSFDLDIMLDGPVYRLNEWLKVTLTLCRAYLRKARVLLIDNIFSKLSLTERKEAFRRFLPLFNKGIVIYATDSTEEAAALSKEVKFLSCGYLMQEGSAEDFIHKPRALSVFSAWAQYPAVIPCVVEEKGILIDGVLCEQVAKLKSDVYLGKEVIAGCLPEDVILADDGFTATVKGVFYLGDDKVYTAETDTFFVWFCADKEISVDSEVKLKVKKVIGLFDALNERIISEVD